MKGWFIRFQEKQVGKTVNITKRPGIMKIRNFHKRMPAHLCQRNNVTIYQQKKVTSQRKFFFDDPVLESCRTEMRYIWQLTCSICTKYELKPHPLRHPKPSSNIDDGVNSLTLQTLGKVWPPILYSCEPLQREIHFIFHFYPVISFFSRLRWDPSFW